MLLSHSAILTNPCSSEPPLARLKVLLIEDDLLLQELLTMFLEQQGVEVTAVAFVDQALERLEQSLPDIILCTVNPDGNGYAFLRRWRQYELDQERTPIPAIALSGLNAERYESLILQAGFQAYLSKPFDLQLFTQTIASLVQREREN